MTIAASRHWAPTRSARGCTYVLRACRKPALSGTTTRLTQVSIIDIVSQCDSPSSSADSSEETPMTDTSHILSRREFVKASAAAAAFAALPGAAFAAAPDKGADTSADKSAVLAEIPKMHAANIRRLQEWIALPSIAAENRNYPQGPEHMAQLARAAGFTDVKIMPTSGKAGVFGRIDAGARTTVGIYFMYDVKQFVPEELSSSRPGRGGGVGRSTTCTPAWRRPSIRPPGTWCGPSTRSSRRTAIRRRWRGSSRRRSRSPTSRRR